MTASELLKVLQQDIAVLKRHIVDNSEPRSSEVRTLASPILRRWLVENQNLGKLQQFRGMEFKFSIPDLRPRQKVCDNGGAILFSGATVKARNFTLFGLQCGYGREAPQHEFSGTEFGSSMKTFTEQKVLFWLGTWVKRFELIRYSANKIAGVHSDGSRSRDVELFLDRVRNLGGVEIYPNQKPRIGLNPLHSGYEHEQRYHDYFFDLISLELISSSRALCSIQEQLDD